MSHSLYSVKLIEVLIAFDVEEILKKNNNTLGTEPNQATSLGNAPDSVYMITPLANAAYGYGQGSLQGVNQGEAGSGLLIKANIGDQIYWRTVSLTDTEIYKCFLYGLRAVSDNHLGDISYHTENVNEPYPEQGWPDNAGVKTEQRADYWVQATVLRPGQETYAFVVAVYDRRAQLKGYVTWDAYLTINNG
ncbi:inclusion body family protein [Burkholderia sp. S-53]|uniref:inclusion body family protein n=1 Tax=Burkholderia sp. S-53 TaxID=2906514 RepID=UPI0021CEDB01|nr:inclusion body family protein [Burkholderia sp. S-53]UXU89605.1 inclusion body family protein [Burkholderia sp. S-53]